MHFFTVNYCFKMDFNKKNIFLKKLHVWIIYKMVFKLFNKF